MDNREKLFNFILSLTDEEAERVAAYLKNNQYKPGCGGKGNDAEKKKLHR